MDHFPLGLAVGQAFCNREEQQRKLLYNIQESRPTLIASPRRYGKTSLAVHVANRSKLKFTQFDFFPAINDGDIEKIILNGVGELISQLEKTPIKILKLATDFFSGLSIKLGVEGVNLQIDINRNSAKPADTILDVLKRLDKLCLEYKKKVILLFDEFQRLYQVTDDQAIEGSIRQIAQHSQNLSFVFLGSNRHLLEKIFYDRNRPFYKLCDKISLKRIETKAYLSYFKKILKGSKKIHFTESAFERVLANTERHPYYVNLLCSRVWRVAEITESVIDKEWENYCSEERSQVANELDLLSNAQRKLLVALARHDGTSSPRSSEFEKFSGIPGATITQALKFLEQKDYIFRDDQDQISVLDPLIKSLIAKY